MADSPPAGDTAPSRNRKEKRKAAKKQKRKQARQDAAARQRQVDEALAADAEEQLRISLREKEEAELAERSRREFEERERLWLEAAAKRREQEEEEAHRRKLLEDSREHEEEEDDNDKWEYIEEGPAEIIWGENEIIVKKKRVKVLKNCSDHSPGKKEEDRPTSNPLPPQSVAFSEFQNGPPLSAQELLESVAQQTPNFGTEQDKAHCPFHLKTGACRFGMRCSRVHFYPDKANTLLMKNMYTGPGLAWELDEGLELPTVEQLLSQYQCYAFDGQCTDEEVAWGYEEFYEDVHTEFLKFGEIVNFKVCRNSSVHLRGNVYVHYKSVESAVLAYNTINGRYFAGKQIKCEFVGVTRWKIAICGEYMKTKLKTCSRGAACNFIHCFRNPGGDYEWADWDNPPPRHWIKKMVVLFGHSVHNELGDIEHREGYSSKKISYTNKRLHSKSSGHGDYNQDSDYENETNSWEERHGNHTSKREHSRKWRERRQSDDDAEQPERKSKASEPNGGHVSRGHIAKRGFSRDKESSEYKNNDLEDYDRFYKRHRSVTSRSKREGKYNNDGDNNSEGSYKCSKGHDRRGSSSRSKTKEKCNSYRYKDSERSYRSSKGYGWKGSPDCDIRGLGDAECSGQTSSNRKSRSVSDNHTGHYDEWLHDCSADKELSWKDQINQVDVIKSREDHEYPERYTPLAYELDENKCQRHKSEDRSISSGESPSGSKNLKRQAHHRESRERYISRERASSYRDSHNGRKKESPSIHKEHTEMLDEEDCCSFDSKDLENTSECSDSDDSLQHRETMHGRSYRSKHEKKRKHEYEYPRGTRDHGTSSPGERRFGKTLQD